MKRWTIIALIGMAVLIASFVAVLYFVPITMELKQSSSVQPPTTIARSSEDVAKDFEPMTEEDWAAFEQRWATAPEEIRELARLITRGDTPNEGTLADLSAEAMSRGYHVPELDFTRNGTPVPYLSTLLQEAAFSYNLEATRALLEVGVDPNVNHGEVLFIVIEQRTRGAPNFAVFPDFDEMLPFLQAYLESGADSNVKRYGFLSRTPFDFADGQHNLGAMLLLLEFGADPWAKLPFPDTHQSDGYLNDSVMEALSFGAGAGPTSETLFRLARSGNLPQGPEKIESNVFRNLSEVGATFASGTGPAVRHTAWRLDQLLKILGAALNREEEAGEIRQKLAKFDYQADGGWYLAEGEIHSRYDAPLSLPDKGSEIWGP